MLHDLWSRLFRRASGEDIAAELAHHLEMKQRELESEGAGADEALYAARRALGNPTGWSEQIREQGRFVWLDSLASDVAYSLRLLRKEKRVTAIAVATLALGIGANTAVFSLLNGLFWRPLPVERPRELIGLSLTHLPPTFKQWIDGKPVSTGVSRQMPYAIYQALARRQQIFSGMFAILGGGDMQLEAAGEPHRVEVSVVTGSYFPVLGVVPEAGRLLAAADDVPGGPSLGWSAVISDALWTRLFSRRASAIGETISIESVPFHICGVAPENFHGTNPGRASDVWIAANSLESVYPNFHWRQDRSNWAMQASARLKPGVTPEQARRHLDAIAPAVLEDAKDPKLAGQDETYFLAMRFSPASEASGESFFARSYGEVLRIVFAAVAAVLLIAITNLANLFLARTAVRRGEIAVRLSLGAPASRIRRQMLIESAILALGGIGAGLLWTRWLIAAFEAAAARGNAAVAIDTSLDWRVFLCLAATLAAVVLLAGCAPALAVSRVRPQEVLKLRRASPLAPGLRGALIVVQTALSLTLILGAGLMLASLRGLFDQPTGFDADHSAFILADLFNAGLGRGRRAQGYDSILAATRALPGVTAAGWILEIPLSGALRYQSFEVPGRDDLSLNQRSMYVHQASDGYFAAAGIPLLAGVDLPPSESPRRDLCVISRNAAERFFGSVSSAVGRRLRSGGEEFEIAGVAGDAKYQNVREAPPLTIYLPYEKTAAGLALAVRYRGSFQPVYSALQALFRKEAGRMPYTEVRTIRGNILDSTGPERMLAWLLGGFASFALLTAVIGLAGLLSYSVEQRKKELGIRLALGATPARIRREVEWQGLRLTALGLAGGAALSYALRRSLDGVLYGIRPADPLVWIAGLAVLLAAGFFAAAIPAARAASVDPSAMLRDE